MLGLGLGITAASSPATITDGAGRIIRVARPGDLVYAFIPTAGDPPSAIPTIRWTLDGAPISGARGVSLVVPDRPGLLSWTGSDSAGDTVANTEPVTVLEVLPPAIITVTTPPALGTVEDGLTEVEVVALVDPGETRTDGGQPVSTRVVLALGGADFAGARTRDGDVVSATVIHSAPGAPDVVILLDDVTVVRRIPPATLAVATPPAFEALETKLTETQVIARVDPGLVRADGGQAVSVAVAVTLNGGPFGAQITGSNDIVSGAVTYSALGAPDLVVPLRDVKIDAVIPPATITVFTFPALGTVEAGLTEIQVIDLVDPGRARTNRGQDAAVAVVATLNGAPFAGRRTADGDTVAGTVTYSAPGAPDMVVVLAGVTVDSDVRPPVTVVDQAVFGADTPVGLGGVPTALSDGIYGEFAVSDGWLAPRISPLTPGRIGFAGFTADVLRTGDRDVSVASDAELAALEPWTLSTPATPDVTIRVRSGAEITRGTSATLGGGFPRPSPLAIYGMVTLLGERDAGGQRARMHEFEATRYEAAPRVASTAAGFTIQGFELSQSDPDAVALILPQRVAGTTLAVIDCVGIGAELDPFGDYGAKIDYSGLSGRFVAGEKIDASSLPAASDHRTILEVRDDGDGTGTLVLSDGGENGQEPNRAGRLVPGETVRGTTGGATATLAGSPYSSIPQTISFWDRNGNTRPDHVLLRGNVLRGFRDAVTIQANRSITIEDNTITDYVSDAISIAQNDADPTGTAVDITVRGNRVARPLSVATDLGNPHSDGLQINDSADQSDWGRVLIEFNQFLDGQSRGTAQQIFLQGGYDHFPDVTIRANIVSGRGQANSLVGVGAVGTVTHNNTVFRELQPNGTAYPDANEPRLTMGGSAAYRFNIATKALSGTNATQRDNDFVKLDGIVGPDPAEAFLTGGPTGFHVVDFADQFAAAATGPRADSRAGARGTPVDWTARSVDTGHLTATVPGVAADLAITEAPFDGYVFDVGQGDPAVGTLIVSGAATPGSAVEIRAAATQGGADTGWTVAVADGAGAWTARLSVPKAAWADWYRPEIRVAGDAASPVAGTNRIGCGHVILDLGQSEREYLYDRANFYNKTPRTHLPAEGLTLVLDTVDNDGTGNIRTYTAEAGTYGAYNGGLTTAVLSAYAAIEAARPGRKWMICDAANPGTSIFSLTNDDSAGRDWEPFQAMLDLVRSGGSEIGLVVLNWVNSTASTLPEMLENWAPIMFGQLASGAAWTLGTTNPENTVNATADYEHIFWDIEAAPDAYGRGVFARDRTKLALLGALPFADTETSEDLAYDNSLRVSRSSREGMRAFAEDPRVRTFLQAYGPSSHIADYGGGIHPLTDNDWGSPQFGQTLVVPALRLSGQVVAEPTLSGAVVDETGRTITLTVGTRQGGTMTTGRKLTGRAAPDPRPPHWQPVIGVEMVRGGMRRPIWNAAAVAADPGKYDPAWAGNVDFDAGGNIEVTLATPLSAGDTVEMRFLEGQASALLLEPRDNAADVYLDLPLEHVPGWVDPQADWPFTGIALRPQPPLGTLAVETGGIVDDPDTPDDPDVPTGTWSATGGVGAVTIADAPTVTAPTGLGGPRILTISR
ncbi:MAG: right-handed parallel beta-helix repeat-containing protein [Pseudomonadota bacterium]